MIFVSLDGAEVVHASDPRSNAMALAACGEMCSKGFVSQFQNSIGGQSRDISGPSR